MNSKSFDSSFQDLQKALDILQLSPKTQFYVNFYLLKLKNQISELPNAEILMAANKLPNAETITDKLPNAEIMMAAAILLASKQCNQERKLRDIINAVFYAITNTRIEINQHFWLLKDGLVAAEGYLLRVLGFKTELDYVLNNYCRCALLLKITDRVVLQFGISTILECIALDSVLESCEFVDGSSSARLVSIAVLTLSHQIVLKWSREKFVDLCISRGTDDWTGQLKSEKVTSRLKALIEDIRIQIKA